MVIASVCWFCAIVLMLLTGVEAISRREGEVCWRLKAGLYKFCDRQLSILFGERTRENDL